MVRGIQESRVIAINVSKFNTVRNFVGQMCDIKAVALGHYDRFHQYILQTQPICRLLLQTLFLEDILL